MTNLSSLAKTILLNHIKSHHSNDIKNGRHRSYSFILDRILFLLSTGCQWSKLPLSWSLENCLSLFLSLVQASDSLKMSLDVIVLVRILLIEGENLLRFLLSLIIKEFLLSCTSHRANKNDSRTFFHTGLTINQFIVKTVRLYTPIIFGDDDILSKCNLVSKNDCIYADKIYDSSHYKDVLNHFSLQNCVSQKRQT
jgi:hypothetical protein